MPKRFQLSRRAGWRMPPNSVKCDRTTKFGNPFMVADYGQPEAVASFRTLMTCEEVDIQARWPERAGELMAWRRRILENLDALTGSDLGCWCRLDQPCHVEVLLDLANRDRAVTWTRGDAEAPR